MRAKTTFLEDVMTQFVQKGDRSLCLEPSHPHIDYLCIRDSLENIDIISLCRLHTVQRHLELPVMVNILEVYSILFSINPHNV